MPDISSIVAALTSIKTATDIAKGLREAELSLERAEVKLKLADLLSALADARMELATIQQTLIDKDQKISELEEAFQSKDSLVRRYDAYYQKDRDGNPTGPAFCLGCWENRHKKCQLIVSPEGRFTRVCTNCGQEYQSRRTEVINPPPGKP